MRTYENGKTLEMMAVVKDQPGKGFSYKKKTLTTDLKDNEVLVKVLTASFCGTDYHIYTYDDWAKKRLKLPLTVGHEFSGEIVKVGQAVDRVKVGDVISAETHIICDECEFCLRGEGHICEKTLIIGVDTDGCFANYIKMPAANCFVNSKDVNPLHLSVQEPLGNAVHTMSHFDIKDKVVAVVGCGPIGLMGVDVSRALGAKTVIAIEVNAYRRNLAKELGADHVVNPLEEDVIEAVMKLTNGKGVDVIGEFSGNKTAIEQAFKYIKPGGGMSLLGIPAQPIELDLATDIVFKGIHIYGVVGRLIYDTWYQVKALIESGKLNLDKIITHEFPLSKINEAAEIMGSGNCGKIVLKPEDDIYE
ncbi:MAG: L-threonine 3-dehydrogenase [Candidatus Izemoplasmataceae bacterium]|jgi:threonine 3-dehydrogenase|uniref:L-threonine 3-dehydrogenase n=1 Tax=Liberiplasma polymorphum TaxID=3374570 RepID=UPI0037724F2A